MSNNSWNCPNCGTAEITSKFCPECGTKRPEPETWECPSCGTKEIKSKFCPECGTKKPETTSFQKPAADVSQSKLFKTTTSSQSTSGIEISQIITRIEQIASTHKIALPPAFYRIKARAKDPILYVGLIGEFSSGKSTLINAWLEDSILKDSIIQATTTSPTMLKNDYEYQISTLLKNGDVINSATTTEAEQFKTTLLNCLHKVSADESYSKDIKLVSLSYPNTVLRDNGFALIDTPGANAENERHKEISGWAVEELCDVAIVLIPAAIPYSSSLDDFIKTYLDRSFKKCIFVMTKVDSLRLRHENELESLVSTVKSRIETSLGIEVPEIMTFAPRLYLNAKSGEEEITEEKQHFVSEFEENTAKLFELIRQKRDEYISFTLSKILKTIISEIQGKLNSQKILFEKRQKLIAANMLPDLDMWFAEKSNTLQQSLNNEYSTKKTEAENWLKNYKSNLSDIILEHFDSLQDVDQIEAFMTENSLRENYLNYSTSEISDYLESIIITNQEFSETRFNELNTEFSNIYRNLATIDPNLPATTKIRYSSFGEYSFSDVNKASEDVANTTDFIKSIGQGIGLVLSGWTGIPGGKTVGGWLTKTLFVDADDIKQKYRPALQQLLDSYFTNFSEAFNKEHQQALSRNIIVLSQMIREYKSSYSQLIKDVQLKENEEVRKLSRNAEGLVNTAEDLSSTISVIENSDAIKFAAAHKFNFLHNLPEIMSTEPLSSNSENIAAILGRDAIIERHMGENFTTSSETVVPDIKTAEELYLQGKFDESFEIFKQLAEEDGNERAMFFLSQFYESGLGNVPLNKKEKNKWLNCAVAMKYPLALLDEIISELMDKNKKSYDENHQEIIKEVSQMADKGDIFAQSSLGAYYLLILDDSDKDAGENKALVDKCLKFLKNPAEHGDFSAQLALGLLYIIQEDYKQGFELLRSSAEQGDTDAEYMVGMAYLNGQGVEENPFKAFEWFMKAAEKGNAEAQNMVGMAYAEGKGIQKNDNEACEWFMKAAEQKLPVAMNNVAFCYEEGKGIEKNEQLAFEWGMKSAKSGDVHGQYRTGSYYQNGFGVKQNHFEAFKWFMKAAEQGNAEAQNMVGMAYLYGNGAQKDDKEAFKWFMKAAEQKLPVAMNNVAFCYENGYGVDENAQSVFEWSMKSAETGDADGQYKTGMCYQTGFGTQQNTSEAFKWFMKSAEQENAEAQNMVGMAYSNGEGTQQNQSEAFQWFMKAAKQELPVAMNNVACCYENATGVIQNNQKAFNWYLKAAEAGYPEAQYKVGLYYYNGIGTEKQDKPAFEWINKAAEQNHEEAKKFLDEHWVANIFA